MKMESSHHFFMYVRKSTDESDRQITDTEHISKKHDLINKKAELKAKLELFERNQKNRFEPAVALRLKMRGL